MVIEVSLGDRKQTAGRHMTEQSPDYTAIIAELQRVYPPLQECSYDIRLSNQEISDLVDRAGVSVEQFLDDIALYLTRGFADRTLGFVHCDTIINKLYQFRLTEYWDTPDETTHHVWSSPGLFYAVYYAFDAGEFYRTPDKIDDPPEDHTRPMIEKILKNLDTTYRRTGEAGYSRHE